MLEVDVCVDVAEAISLFISLLHAPLRHAEVDVAWSSAPTLPAQHCAPSPPQHRIQCVIQAHGLGAYFLDGVAFVQRLYSCCPGFEKFIDKEVSIPAIELVCRRIGDPCNMSCYTVHGVQSQGELRIRESLQVVDQLPTTSLSFTLMCTALWEELEQEMAPLSQQLHLLHVINPEVAIKLHLLRGHGEQVLAEFPQEPSRCLLSSHFKLATSLHHYRQTPPSGVSRGKLRLVKGETVVLPSCVRPGEEGAAMDLQLCCMVALVPHKAVPAGRKLHASSHCTHVKVHVLAPALPVLRPNTDTSTTSTLPLSLVEWEHYGITLGEPVPTDWSSPVLVPALQRIITRGADAEESGSQPVGAEGSGSKKSVLHVFLFVEERNSCHAVIGENSHWGRGMGVVSAMRRELATVVEHHSTRVHQATHTALNKLFFNHTTHTQLRHRLEGVIPAVAQAVSSIVTHSLNRDFTTQCKHLLQVLTPELVNRMLRSLDLLQYQEPMTPLESGDGEDSVREKLSRKLWQLAQQTLDVNPPQLCYQSSRTTQPSHHFETLGSTSPEAAELPLHTNPEPVASEQSQPSPGPSNLFTSLGSTPNTSPAQPSQHLETLSSIEDQDRDILSESSCHSKVTEREGWREDNAESVPTEEIDMWEELEEGGTMWLWEHVEQASTGTATEEVEKWTEPVQVEWPQEFEDSVEEDGMWNEEVTWREDMLEECVERWATQRETSQKEGKGADQHAPIEGAGAWDNLDMGDRGAEPIEGAGVWEDRVIGDRGAKDKGADQHQPTEGAGVWENPALEDREADQCKAGVGEDLTTDCFEHLGEQYFSTEDTGLIEFTNQASINEEDLAWEN